jgi:WhiB family redox-sensing transcriptional regulator
VSRTHLAAWETSPDEGTGDWRERAACLSEDADLFFPIGNTGLALVQIEEAKMVCLRCPVRETCLEWALSKGEDAGVWGGLSEDERKALRRRESRARYAAAQAAERGEPVKPAAPNAGLQIDVGPVKAVIDRYRAQGKSPLAIARMLDVSESTVREIELGNRKFVTQRIADRIIVAATVKA